VFQLWRPAPTYRLRLLDEESTGFSGENRGSFLGAVGVPALTFFKGDLFLTSRYAPQLDFQKKTYSLDSSSGFMNE